MNRLLKQLRPIVLLMILLGLILHIAVTLLEQRSFERAKKRYNADYGSLGLAQFVLPELENVDNAAFWIGVAAELVTGEDVRALKALTREQTTDWTPKEIATASRVVATNELALSFLDRGVNCTETSFAMDYARGPLAVILPDITSIIPLARLVHAEGQLAILDGDGERLKKQLNRLYKMSESFAQESLVITALVGARIEKDFHWLLRDGLAQAAMRPEAISWAERVVAARDPHEVFLRGIRWEASWRAEASMDELASMRVGHMSGPVFLPALSFRMRARHARSRFLDSVRELIAQIKSVAGGRGGVPMEGAGADWPLSALGLAYLPGRLGESLLGDFLALEALRLARYGWENDELPVAPELPDQDPYSGGALAYRLLPDGSAVLDAPAARQRWEEINRERLERLPPPTRWVIRAPLHETEL